MLNVTVLASNVISGKGKYQMTDLHIHILRESLSILPTHDREILDRTEPLNTELNCI